MVDPTALRALAGTAATPAWDDGLAAMCAYAATKGWVEDDGGIVAHIEPGPGDGLRPAVDGAAPAAAGGTVAGRRAAATLWVTDR